MEPTKIEAILDGLASVRDRRVTSEDVVTASPLIRMAAWLDRDADTLGPTVPAGWHTLFFLSRTLQRDLGPEGGTPHDNLVPHVPLDREMWVGSRLHISGPLRVGDSIRKVGTLHRLDHMQGRSGPFIWLTVREEIFGPSGLAVTEETDLIFRDVPTRDAAPTLPPEPQGAPQWRRSFAVDTPFLFRYSALTYNSHRIHYDQAHTVGREQYPGLLVHGPLQAALLLDLLSQNLEGRSVVEFSCRARSPAYEGQTITANGAVRDDNCVDLWLTDQAGKVCMTASAKVSAQAARTVVEPVG